MSGKKDGLISVIVPVYGAEAYIAKTIAIVAAQTFEAWELLLIEDASPDGSAEVVRRALAGCRRQDVTADLSAEIPNVRAAESYTDEIGRRILLLCKEKNEGAAAARNTGLKLAQGRYIAFLDADDVWHSDKLEKEFAFMQKKQAGFVFCAYEFGDRDAAPTGKVVHVPPHLTYREALSRTVIFTTTVLLDREKIADELIEMPRVESEDTATWWRILRAGHTAYGLDETLAVYRRPPKSLSSNKAAAVRRIWNLYRRQEGLSVIKSLCCLIPWAYRAAARRL
ncbi:MAG: glycosyltransferase family 2 protein [Bacteroidales bacterium]|nr:glycosyltransferase family 2 protein [Bacteroidales bacterium]MCM1415534.1 glycosyltransferase family 2 protein [bacterium]MCM1423734.1 glycosyltransferase family 2 protein [bacterium]